ncbi:hypothetical protein PIB30_068867 [Stylosanthes scabra]|uniref:Uncharacterized protein n=1 Tax=Stylosanthes scabra TaxID=79078 RepID=A0ABU6VPX8_9FABA|nr:hypothetical protein [Stylosanthes scabra]
MFVVVSSKASYNALLGCDWIHDVGVVPSTMHQILFIGMSFGASKEFKMMGEHNSRSGRKTRRGLAELGSRLGSPGPGPIEPTLIIIVSAITLSSSSYFFSFVLPPTPTVASVAARNLLPSPLTVVRCQQQRQSTLQ